MTLCNLTGTHVGSVAKTGAISNGDLVIDYKAHIDYKFIIFSATRYGHEISQSLGLKPAIQALVNRDKK